MGCRTIRSSTRLPIENINRAPDSVRRASREPSTRQPSPSKTAVCFETRPIQSPSRSTVDSRRTTWRSYWAIGPPGVGSLRSWLHSVRETQLGSEPIGLLEIRSPYRSHTRLPRSVDHQTKLDCVGSKLSRPLRRRMADHRAVLNLNSSTYISSTVDICSSRP